MSSTVAVERSVDDFLLAELAAERIISGFPVIPETQTQTHSTLISFIYNILRDSSLPISIITSALAQADEYHVTMYTFFSCNAYDLKLSRHLFLASYIAASRAVHDSLGHLMFWKTVFGEKYSPATICATEHEFVDMMREWRRQEDTGSSSDGDDSENENTLVEFNSATISFPDVATSNPNALEKCRIGVIEVALKLAADRLKESARMRSPAYSKDSSLSPGR